MKISRRASLSGTPTLAGPRGGAFITALIVLAASLLVWWQACRWYEQQLWTEQRAAAAFEVADRGDVLSSAINRRLARLQGLYAFVQAELDNPDFDSLFETYAAGLYIGSSGIRNIAVAPDGAMRYVYPLEGNESIIGYRPLDDLRPEVRAAVEEAVNSREMVLNGPVDLLQGGLGIIARQAVYDQGNFWGLVNLALDLEPVAIEAGIAQPVGDLEFALRDQTGWIFWGSPGVYEREPVITNVLLPEGQWQLAAAPHVGWAAAVEEPMQIFQAAGLVIVGLITSLTYLTVNRQERLRLDVQQRTEQISAINQELQQDIVERKRAEAALREREEQYRSIFESSTDGLFINDLTSGQMVDFNPAAALMHGYTEEEFRQLQPAQFIHPDSLHLFTEYLDAIRAGQEFRGRAIDVRKDGTLFHIDVLGTAFTYRGRPSSLAIVRDVTEQVEAYQLLEERVAERTRELSTLLEISRNSSLTLELGPLMELLLDQLKIVVDYIGASILSLEGEEYRILTYRGPASDGNFMGVRLSVDDHYSQYMMATGQPVIIDDIQADSPETQKISPRAMMHFRTSHRYVRSYLAAPLIVRERFIGILNLHHDQSGYFNSRHAELAMAFAGQVAVAIENARLFQTVQRGVDQFRAISELGQRITSILNVDQLLSETAHLIHDTFGYYHVHIGLIEENEVVFPACAGVWDPDPDCLYCATLRLQVGVEGICGYVASAGEALMVPDISQEPRYLHPKEVRGSGVIVPLKVKGQVIGVMDVEHDQINAFDEQDVAVLQLLANQVAVAIANARLYEQAQSLAALQERQKLARELHDSVSQALYGIALGTRTARTLLDRAALPAEQLATLSAPLEYVMSLAQAGLAEMRALIFELRPESLATDGLVAALTRQTDALRARHGIEVETSIGPEPEAPLAVKETLYRVAQEALNNVVKHASASRVEVRLEQEDGLVLMEIRDNGQGFDTQGAFPGHMGLQSMRERIADVGGALEIESGTGQGTRIQARIGLKGALETERAPATSLAGISATPN